MILLRGGSVVTMDAARTVRVADLLVDGDRIARIGRIRAPRGADVLDCAGKAVLPGFVQAHVHLCQTLFRNLADGLDLLEWLEKKIWPYEASHDETSLAFSARLGIAELLLGGTTSVLDMATVRHTEAVLRAAEEGGIRYTGGKCLMDTGPGPLPENGATALREAEELGRKWHGAAAGRIRWALCPRFALSCTPALLRGVRDLGAREGWLVHTHASENWHEVELVRERTGAENVCYLDDAGLCGPRTVLAHCVQVTLDEIQTLARTATSVAHCPGANLKLASGHAPLTRLLSSGVNVALGADSAACNNTLDVFHEMRLAATMHLPASGVTAVPPAEVLAMATLRGAQALGLSREIGSIEAGKKADITVVDISAPHFQPAGPDLHATIVYCARASDVTDVLVDGKLLVRDRRLLSLDARELAAGAPAEARRILSAR
jgi:cytosine/adenosine deaminase-related metal-dependent hydrolase